MEGSFIRARALLLGRFRGPQMQPCSFYQIVDMDICIDNMVDVFWGYPSTMEFMPTKSGEI